MGNSVTTFTDEQLEAYQDCTFFTKKEILRLQSGIREESGWGSKRFKWCTARIFHRYRLLSPDRVPLDMRDGKARKVKIPFSEIEVMNELRENPFCTRICQVFSDDGSGDMSFDEFLDMFSVFSEAAPRDIKCVYAFRIYDYDGDNHLSKPDLENTLSSLTRGQLSSEEMTFVINKVLEEADLDDDKMLSYIEFEHVISRSPDFLNTFHIRI